MSTFPALLDLGNSYAVEFPQMVYQSGNAARTATKPKDRDLTMEEYAYWGPFNCRPTVWRKKLEESTLAARAFARATEIFLGKGVCTYIEALDESYKVIGRDIVKPPEVQRFFKKNQIDTFLQERTLQYQIHGNVACEFILSQDRSRIIGVNHLDSEFCRKSREHDRIGFSAEWRNNDASDANIVDIELLDNKNAIEQIRRGSRYKYALWNNTPMNGRIHYAFPTHGGLFKKDGWLDHSNAVPVLLNNLQQKQVKIRYIIRIHEYMWRRWFPQWEQMKEKDRVAAYEEKVRTLRKQVEGSGRKVASLIATDFHDPATGNTIQGVKIEAIDDKIKTGEWLPNSNAADAQTVQAIGIDPSELGLQPAGGKMGAGSGSDKRTSRINKIGLTSAEAQILAPLYLIAEYNGWGENLEFTFRHQLPTTLDRNAKGVTEQTTEI